MTEPATSADFELVILPDYEKESLPKNQKLEEFFYGINLLLGGDGIEIDLSDNDYRFCFNRALNEFRAISTRSIYESYGFLQLSPNVQTYRLHRAIDNVIGMYRQRALFASNATGFDYFSQIAANTIYPGGHGGGYMGLATYDFALQYEETLNRLFARDIRFQYHNWNQTLFLQQVPHSAHETVVIRCAVMKTITELLDDHWSFLWLQKYSTALAKSILAAKWGKLMQLPGAQGGIQYNWQKLAQESTEEIKECKQAIYNLEDGGTPAYPAMM
jgi:hypothetical protein